MIQKIHTINTSDQATTIELVNSGEDYFSRLKHIIATAQSEIHIQTYIFDNDSTGKEIIDALKEAMSRNVKVYLLLDAYGSASLHKAFTTDLIQHGIHFRFFSPFFSKNFYIGRRLHHKVVVADEKTTLIGGINIADKYRGNDTKEPWLDYAVQIEGEIAKPLQELCRNIYLQKNWQRRKKIEFIFQYAEGASARILQNDWIKQKNEIFTSYINAIKNAKREIIIVGSYFIPGRRLTYALKKASLRGVKTKIILSGISDVPIVRHATRYFYSSLLKYNIELYEWNKSVLHGKAAIIDNQWATIGSFNLNHLSSYGSIEMNVEINSGEFSKIFTSQLNKVIAECEQITLKTLKTRNGIFTKFRNWLSYRLVRTSLIILTYSPYKRFFMKS